MDDSGPNARSGSAEPIEEACAREIRALHQFFEEWLGGARPETDAAFRRVEAALGEGFQLIHPSGERRSRRDVLAGLRRAHGSTPGLTIEIRDVRGRRPGDALLVATYEEWQRTDEAEDGRLSTVVFARSDEAPNGLRWLHVHETWIKEPS